MPYNDEGWVYDFRTNGGHVDENTEKIKGPGVPLFDSHEHVFYVQNCQKFACSDCGNSEEDKFRTIVNKTADGDEYELECSKCESREIEESPALALHRMSEKLENYRNAWEELKTTMKRDAELGQGHKVKRALFLIEEFEKTMKLD